MLIASQIFYIFVLEHTKKRIGFFLTTEIWKISTE